MTTGRLLGPGGRRVETAPAPPNTTPPRTATAATTRLRHAHEHAHQPSSTPYVPPGAHGRTPCATTRARWKTARAWVSFVPLPIKASVVRLRGP